MLQTEMAFGEILDMAGASLQERGGAGEVAEAVQEDSFFAAAAAAAHGQQTQSEEENGDGDQRRQVYLAQVRFWMRCLCVSNASGYPLSSHEYLFLVFCVCFCVCPYM